MMGCEMEVVSERIESQEEIIMMTYNSLRSQLPEAHARLKASIEEESHSPDQQGEDSAKNQLNAVVPGRPFLADPINDTHLLNAG